MLQRTCLPTDMLRARFSAAMAAMYRHEVPAYGPLADLAERVNAETVATGGDMAAQLASGGALSRLSQERHGAIRLGTAAELAMIRRVFAVMGMSAVGYYDLSAAGVPVHATVFRPVEAGSLRRNPFRVFTSLLRLELIPDPALRAEAEAILSARQIFSPTLTALVDRAEAEGGLSEVDGGRFVAEVLDSLRWQGRAAVSPALYRRFRAAHPLLADVVAFPGPHITHLTPRTLDIDRVQARMAATGMTSKPIIEGPPTRRCPILLRQTCCPAPDEPISFPGGDHRVTGHHPARYGEVEQRGIALTPKGRALYDRLLAGAQARVRPAPDGSNAAVYRAALTDAFRAFPDDWDKIREQGLGYFRWSLTEKSQPGQGRLSAATALARGLIRPAPLTYEDFLPVSAAGIVQSNLGGGPAPALSAAPDRARFETDLGAAVLDPDTLYAAAEAASLRDCLDALL